LPRSQWWLIGSLLLAVGAANIRQPHPDLAPLQHAPTVLLCLAAPWLLRRWPLSTGVVALVWSFLLLHTLGGRYIYSYVPYDSWFAEATGQTLSAMFGMARNGYDRLVHLGFGLLLTPVVAEIGQRHGGMERRAAWFSAFATVGLISALYEIFEWLLTMLLAPDMAEGYNGQQGDMWDPQKDMAIAQLGSATSILLALADRLRRRLSFRRS
jgi:putative membrane protein